MAAARILLGVLLVGITVVALLPPQTEIVAVGWDKLNHFAAFAVLAVLVRCSLEGAAAPVGAAPRAALQSSGLWPSPRHCIALLMLLGYGILLELLQGSFTDRTASTADVVANALGLAAGALLYTGGRRYGIRQKG